MERIIRKNFRESDFKKLVQQFAEKQKLDEENLKIFQQRALKMGSTFSTIFTPYFTKKDNSRHDEVVLRMSEFLKRLKISIKLSKQQNANKELINFWKEVTNIVSVDAKRIGDSYLKNDCGYLEHQIGKL